MNGNGIAYQLRSGRWERIGHGVYRLAGAPQTWRGDVRAAALSVQGLGSHGTAATVHAIDGWDQSRIEVVVDQARRPSASPRIVVHRSKQMALADATEIDGIPVTGLARTVLDIAAVVGPKRLEWTVDAVLRDGRLTWPDLYAVWSRHSARGRDGCGRLYRLLERRYGSLVVPDSKFNRMVGQLLQDAGLDGFLYEYEVRSAGSFLARVDLAFPAERLAIECDSRQWHDTSSAFESDRSRANRLTVAGWTVLRFTWKAFIESPASIVNDVYNALHFLRQNAN